MSETGLQEIVCCLGDVVAGNPLQYVIEKAFAAKELEDWRCLTSKVALAKLADAIAGVKAMGFRGLHFAGTFQAAVLPLLDDATPAAKRAGRCDIATREGERLIGDNLLGASLMTALGPEFSAKEKRVVILGAGGMARCAIAALADAGATSFQILARHPGRGEAALEVVQKELAPKALLTIWNGLVELDDDADLVINCTSAGAAKLPLSLAEIRSEATFVDVSPNPLNSWLLREAAARGCRVVDGVSILAAQLEAIFRRWTGVEPPEAVMREALEEFLGV